MILTLCIEAFTPHIEDVLWGYHLLLPGQIPDLQLQIENLVFLALVPWDHLVRTSYSAALANCQIDPSWGVPTLLKFIPTLLKFIEHAMPSHDDNCMNQFIDLFVGVLHLDEKSYLIDVFSGTAPFTNNSLRKLASAGAYFFDHVYSQVAVLMKTQQLPSRTS